jgi:radical SAM superfamily enzyme YgiQ (UPF0313 family)
MTYWYLGYKEVIDELKKHWPRTKIVLGGPYSMICSEHAKNLGADFIFGDDVAMLATAKQTPTAGVGANQIFKNPVIGDDGAEQLPQWGLYKNLTTAAMKITCGCPFKCTYCSVPIFCDGFTARPIEQVIEELKYLISLGVKNIAFYDDALLYKSDEVLKPFLRYVIENGINPAPIVPCQNPEKISSTNVNRNDFGLAITKNNRCGVNVSFHTPNALNARFIDKGLADLMIKAGFKSFYLGFESRADEFQKQTGSKVFDNEFARAVKNLIAAGADKSSITAYLMLGHPRFEIQDVEESMKFVHNLGARIMLADFSPIPGTPDGRLAEKYVGMNEPLMHNKTAFPIILFGDEEVTRIKDMCRKLNDSLRKI